MSLVSWLATVNQPVGIESPSAPDLENDLPARDHNPDPTEVVQQNLIQPARLLKVLTIRLHRQQ